ncbi:Alpha/Beta hydrolase protein [Cladorrhinum sp. PSN332]|nr:Alpha/Beta hydrolase protein [Cladorrhinum sp. PSN332]
MKIPPDAHVREVFYVGGETTKDPYDGTGILHGQIYVEHLKPVVKPQKPVDLLEPRAPAQRIIFIPGSGRTSVDFLSPGRGLTDHGLLEPDRSKRSWASFFLSNSHTIYLIDPPFRGRSPFSPGLNYTTFPSTQLAQAWFKSPQMHGDPLTMEHILASTYPQFIDLAEEQRLAQKGLVALLDRICPYKHVPNTPAFLLAHSMGAKAAWLVADAKPKLVKGIIAVEPAGPPFRGVGVEMARYGITEAPINFAPEGELTVKEVDPGGPRKERKVPVLLQDESQGEVKQLVNLKNIPVLVITSQTSVHKGYDWGTVEFLKQSGVGNVEHVELEDVGIEGNGHMMMLEGNRAEVGKVILDWMYKVDRESVLAEISATSNPELGKRGRESGVRLLQKREGD